MKICHLKFLITKIMKHSEEKNFSGKRNFKMLRKFSIFEMDRCRIYSCSSVISGTADSKTKQKHPKNQPTKSFRFLSFTLLFDVFKPTFDVVLKEL